jgi:nucleotide-binding universal stress UspA family protein
VVRLKCACRSAIGAPIAGAALNNVMGTQNRRNNVTILTNQNRKFNLAFGVLRYILGVIHNETPSETHLHRPFMTQPFLNTQSNSTIQLGPPSSAMGPLIVATHGHSDADSAIIAAKLFAERTNAAVQVITAIAPVALGYTMGVLPLTREIDSSQRDAQVAATTSQLARLTPPEAMWPVTAEFGEPAQTIADLARLRSARLIVLGHPQNSTSDKSAGGEHILQALQTGDTPVFAAMQGMTKLPSRVVIATDFSDLSAYAAQFALPFIAPDANIFLVNVMPDVNAGGGGWEHDWADNYRRGLADAFNRSKNALHREALTIEPITLTGNASEQILKFASEKDADLIVCGTHGYGFFRRLILGSVATKIVRDAQCSVLCVPGSSRTRANMRQTARDGGSTRAFVSSDWPEAINAFSKRNEGRPCTIEVDQSDLGAQVESTSVPFVGASYDPHDNSVALMFGARADGDHFTHTVDDVTGIDVLVDVHGADESLRVANPTGQTIVTLASATRFEDERDNY